MKLNFFHWSPQHNNASQNSKTLVFLHGMGGTGKIWRPIAAQLEDHFNCIAFDQRGHGESQSVPDSELQHFHALDYAKDVEAMCEELNLESVILIGHSMGVRTALAMAHLNPKRVSKLIAVDIGISSEWGGGVGKSLADFIQNLPEKFSERSELKDYVFEHCPDPAIAQYLTAVSQSDDSGNWIFPFRHEALVRTIHQANEAPIEDWANELRDRKIPVIFLRGANSKVWKKEDYTEQSQRFASSTFQFEEWENAGHGLPFEQRARFIQLIQDWALEEK